MNQQHVAGRAEPHHIGAGIYSIRIGDQCIAAYLKESNARRVAACLNACEGSETEDLERLGSDYIAPVIKLIDDRNAAHQRLATASELLMRVFQADVLAGDFDEEVRRFLADELRAIADHPNARARAEQDAVLYGMGLMVNGQHVPLESVMIAYPPARWEAKA